MEAETEKLVWAGDSAQRHECLPGKCEVMSLVPGTTLGWPDSLGRTSSLTVLENGPAPLRFQ